MTILYGMKPEFIGSAVNDAALDPAAGEPCAKALRMMIASGALSARRTAKFRAKNHQGLLQQATLFEVLQ